MSKPPVSRPMQEAASTAAVSAVSAAAAVSSATPLPRGAVPIRWLAMAGVVLGFVGGLALNFKSVDPSSSRQFAAKARMAMAPTSMSGPGEEVALSDNTSMLAED